MPSKTLLLLSCLIACTQLQAQKISKTQDDVIYLSLKPGISIQRFITGGDIGKVLVYNTPLKFYCSANLDIQPNRWLILKLEIIYVPASISAKGNAVPGKFYEYELRAYSFGPAVALMLHAPWKWKIRPYIGAGISGWSANVRKNVLKVSSETGTKITDGYIRIDGPLDAPNYNFGITYKNFDFTCRYYLARWNKEETDHIFLGDRRLSVTGTYRFGFN